MALFIGEMSINKYRRGHKNSSIIFKEYIFMSDIKSNERESNIRSKTWLNIVNID